MDLFINSGAGVNFYTNYFMWRWSAFLGNQLVKYLDGEWYGLGKRNFLERCKKKIVKNSYNISKM